MELLKEFEKIVVLLPLILQLSGHFKYTIADIDSNIITLSNSSPYASLQIGEQARQNDWIGMEIYLKEGQSD